MNTREQVIDALLGDDELKDLDCFYLDSAGEPSIFAADYPQVIHCWGDELPTREYNAGYGGVEGEPVVCFSKKRVYFRATYDGNEWIDSVPRNPGDVTAIPVIGS